MGRRGVGHEDEHEDEQQLCRHQPTLAAADGRTPPPGHEQAVAEGVALLEMARGGPARFRDEPTAHMVQGAGVPPLRFAEERCLIKEQAIRHGFPIMLASAPQAGATAPAALAGTIVQVVAEALAGLIYANVLSPGHPICFAPWPFVCELRTRLCPSALSGVGFPMRALDGPL